MTNPFDALAGVCVVELATGISGPYAGKLFADAGARVIKVEPPGGDGARASAPSGVVPGSSGSALFQHLNVSKQPSSTAMGDGAFEALLANADLVIESADQPFDVDLARLRSPRLVVLSLTPFGRRSSWFGRPATGFTVQAESGSIGSRGRREQVPFQAGGRVAEWAAGVCGAVGALAAVMRALKTGIGEHVDCALVAVDQLVTNGNVALRDSLAGHPEHDDPARFVDVPCIEPTADGFIGLNLNTRQHVESFLTLIGRDDLRADDGWASATYRFLHSDEWNALVRPWLAARPTAEVVARATAARLPTATVNNGSTLVEQEQFVNRRAIAPHPDGTFMQPQPPYRIDGVRPTIRRGPPADRVPHPRATDVDLGGELPLPFRGLRVLDATTMWAGPTVGQVLGALGADVIHLESIQRLDLARLKSDSGPDVPEWWERGHNWLMLGWNKRDLTIDLADPRGLALLEALIPHCDVLVENFAPRVFERFGLDSTRVLGINPSIVFARMPAFGLDGPWRDSIGFAQTMEQMSGMAWVTGHVEGPPDVPRGPCDPIAGYHALFAIMAALMQRRSTGRGCQVEAAMVEAALNATAASIVDWSAYGVVHERRGNRSFEAAPQGVYRCAGREQWLAVSVQNDRQWGGLVAALGVAEWKTSSLLRTEAGRRAAHDEIDGCLGAWADKRSADEAAAVLLGHGVPAAVVNDPRRVDGHPLLVEIGYFEDVVHPVTGRHRTPTLPFRFASVDRWVQAAAPCLGEHNDEILTSLLRLSPSEVSALEADGVIGRSPLATNPSFIM
jgi:crotonobetainyl-CoA:carnitine CoA-transferase CaiB-like acyl-CoA transferase